MAKRGGMQGRVVVITGASSGLGRAAAVEFARERCCLALAARRVAHLEDTASLCRAAGAEVMVVPTDVTDSSEVQRLVDATLHRWSRIDVWVNNAGVTMFGTLQAGALADHQRVIDTNLNGPIRAARAVVPIFMAQQSGIMINVASILGKVGQAFVPSYVISKFALRGMTEALRVQLADYRDIHICTLLPYAIDTPHFESGANVIGRAARPMQPVQSPERVAHALVDLARWPRRERHVPRYAVFGLAAHWLLPRTVERLLLHALNRFHLDAKQPVTPGALYQPPPGPAAVHGSRHAVISRASFAAWTIKELAAMVVSGLRRWRTQRTTRL